MNPDTDKWIGHTLEADDIISTERAFALWASLDDGSAAPEDGAPLPPLWHWLYFWVIGRRSELGRDGHAALGGFLPALGEVRRMWAGSRVTFHRPLSMGERAHRRITITDLTPKVGRSGALTFVTLRHEISGTDGLAITEDQDLVYREMPKSGAGASAPRGEPAPESGDRVETWTGDPVLLFRYSALTFNGHRIHYDAPYSAACEGYPGLVVHGPLVASLMASTAMRHRQGEAPATFSFRAQSPIFADQPFTIHVADHGASSDVWVRNAQGNYAFRGEVGWQGR
ncbi:MAG: acyl-CoA dehydrogenase [Rhizobiales bacterium]|nr:acyl-CoA dehydrogenase [Hyphomicrobiales bacterium]